MKKCYVSPEMVVVDLDMESIIAQSPTPDGFDEEDYPAASSASYRSSLWN